MENNSFQVRDLRNGNWFWVQKIILSHLNLNASDKLVYCALAFFANTTTQKCYPSYTKIQQLTNINSRATISASLKRLEEEKLIKVKRNVGRVSTYLLIKLKDKPVQKLNQFKRDTTTSSKEIPRTIIKNNNNIYINKEKWKDIIVAYADINNVKPDYARNGRIAKKLLSYSFGGILTGIKRGWSLEKILRELKAKEQLTKIKLMKKGLNMSFGNKMRNNAQMEAAQEERALKRGIIL